MAKNFMEAGTEIDSMIAKKEQVLDKISNILADACVSRSKSGKVSDALEMDINNLIKSLPTEDQVYILRKLSVTLAKQLGGVRTTESSDSTSRPRRNDIFKNRSF